MLKNIIVRAVSILLASSIVSASVPAFGAENPGDKGEISKAGDLPAFDYDVLFNQLSADPEGARMQALQYLASDDMLSVREQGRASNVVAISYAVQGNLEAALPFAEQTYTAAVQSKDRENISGALTNLANIHRQIGNLEEAIRSFEAGISYARETQSYNFWAAALFNLADMLVFYDATFLAMPLYEEAEQLIDKVADPAFLAAGLLSKANAHVSLGQSSEAAATFDRAKILLGADVSVENQADLLMVRAELGLLRGVSAEAESSAAQCLSIAQQYGLNLAKANCLLTGTRVAISAADLSAARTYLSDFAETLDLPSDEADAASLRFGSQYFRLLAEIQELEGDSSSALISLQRSMVLGEALEERRHQAELAYFSAGFSEQAKDLRIALMDQRSLTMELEAERSALIMWAAALVAALLAGLSWVLYRSYNNANSDRNALEIALDERDVLMAELSHRVSNSYQMILSMVRLQKLKALRAGASGIDQIDDIQSRVRAMSAIQVKLLGDVGTDFVSLQVFVKELAENLRDASGKQFEIKVDLPSLTLRASDLAPLGLIANEIITNSVKHAFSNEADDHAIAIEFSETDESYCLAFSDNGEGMGSMAQNEQPGLGLNFIKDLADQLGGNAEMSSAKPGTRWQICLPKSLENRASTIERAARKDDNKGRKASR